MTNQRFCHMPMNRSCFFCSHPSSVLILDPAHAPPVPCRQRTGPDGPRNAGSAVRSEYGSTHVLYACWVRQDSRTLSRVPCFHRFLPARKHSAPVGVGPARDSSQVPYGDAHDFAAVGILDLVPSTDPGTAVHRVLVGPARVHVGNLRTRITSIDLLRFEYYTVIHVLDLASTSSSSSRSSTLRCIVVYLGTLSE